MLEDILLFILCMIVFGSLLLGSWEKDPLKRYRYKWVFMITFLILYLVIVLVDRGEVNTLEIIVGIAIMVLALFGGGYAIDRKVEKAKDEFIIETQSRVKYAEYILKDYNYRNPTGIPGGAGGGVGTSNELSEILINGATTGGGVNLFIIFDGDYGGLWDLSGKVNAVGGGAVRGNKLFVGGLSWNGSSGGGQYRETDFNFISRLMQEEGIWWGIGGNSSYSSPGERVNRPIFGSGLSHTREHVLLGRQVGIPTSSNHGRVSERLRHKNRAFIPEIDDQVLTSKKSKLDVDGIVGPGQ